MGSSGGTTTADLEGTEAERARPGTPGAGRGRIAALLIAVLAALVCTTGAPSAHASLPPSDGVTYTLMGCSAWKTGGIKASDAGDPTNVAHYNIVQIRTCLYRYQLKAYSRTMWYLPSGGKVVASVWAGVRNCTTNQVGQGTLDGYNMVAGPTSASTAWSSYSPTYTVVSGNSYQAKGYIGGQADVNGITYNLNDDWNIHNVNVASSCYKL